VTTPVGGRLRVSVIVPSWRDAENLALLLPAVAAIDSVAETIVVDVSGDAESQKIAQEFGAHFVACSAPNRGAQMNVGAMLATGEVLLFQHADTELRPDHVHAIETAMLDPQLIGGAFYRKFDRRHPYLVWLEPIARLRSRRGGTLYGDQSIFVRREVFLHLGGFARIPLMEDVEFSRRLRAAGKIALLDPPTQTSARRHAGRGAWRTSMQNALFIVLYKFGVAPERLHQWYYRERLQMF
jgi:rSAM/selenodomain-associated transferase 2